MERDVTGLQAKLRRRFFLQLFLLLLVAGGVFFWKGKVSALAAGFGYGMAIVNALLLHWHMLRAVRLDSPDPHRNLRIMIRCGLERFVVTVGLFTLGIGVWHLPALLLIVGFIIGMAAQYIDGIHNED
jgi:hypothetical protein